MNDLFRREKYYRHDGQRISDRGIVVIGTIDSAWRRSMRHTPLK